MPKAPKFIPKLTDDGWMVLLPASMTGTGKIQRRFFGLDEKAAERFAKTCRGQYHAGQRGGLIPHALATQAAEADKLLEGSGLSLIDAVKETLAVRKILEGTNVAPIEAARIVEKQWKSRGSAETLRERWIRYREEHEPDWRQAYILQMNKLDRWVGPEFMQMQVQAITDDLIRAALQANGSKTKSTIARRMTMINSVINDKGKKRRAGRIEIMTVSQCAAMLRACQNELERRAVALLLFAGIRPFVDDGEITRLNWKDVGELEIYITPDVSKTGTDRHIPITPRLRRLIKGHPKEGKVIPNRWNIVYQRLRAAAAIGGKVDITRHTFASHFLAVYGEDKTKSAMGHSANSTTLFRHYRRAVVERDGRKYFSDYPPQPKAVKKRVNRK